MIDINDIENQIINADCIDILKQLPDKCIDLVLTDPPYELNLNGGKGKAFSDRALVKDKHIDFIAHGFDYEGVFEQFKRICKPLNLFIFCSNKQISKIMSYFENDYMVTLLCWHKPNAIPLVNNCWHSNLEFIVCVHESGGVFNNLPLKEKSKVITMPYPAANIRIHPTEKPVKLIELLLKTKSLEGGLVLDCFSGSGTTAIACHNLKRRFICIEKDKDYWKASVERLKNAQAQMKLF